MLIISNKSWSEHMGDQDKDATVYLFKLLVASLDPLTQTDQN